MIFKISPWNLPEYSLQLPHWGNSKKYPQDEFLRRWRINYPRIVCFSLQHIGLLFNYFQIFLKFFFIMEIKVCRIYFLQLTGSEKKINKHTANERLNVYLILIIFQLNEADLSEYSLLCMVNQ